MKVKELNPAIVHLLEELQNRFDGGYTLSDPEFTDAFRLLSSFLDVSTKIRHHFCSECFADEYFEAYDKLEGIPPGWCR